MVNIGKPSNGCSVCKSRHVKCDESKPFCRRCQMIGRVCPGYPDPWDVVFHDETRSTRQKTVGSRKLTPLQAGRTTSAVKPQALPVTSAHVAPLLLVRPSAPSLEDVAIECMLHGWSKISTPVYRQGWLDLIVPIYVQQPESSSFRYACNALALCGFWKSAKLPQLAEPAYRCYAQAIRSTYAAIADPSSVKKDSTLMSILLLASFETIDCSDFHGLACRRHLEGAIHLVGLRGKEQLQEEVSLRLFRGVRTCLLTDKLIRSQVAATPDGFEWFPKGERSMDFITEMAVLGGRVAKLRARCSRLFDLEKNLTSDSINMLFLRSTSLLRALSKWRERIPPDFTPHILRSRPEQLMNTDTDEVWNGIVRVHNGVFEACLDGEYHTLRLYVHAVMLRCRHWQMSRDNTVYNDFTTSEDFKPIQDAVDNICYIIPYTLEQMPDRRKEPIRDPYELSSAAKGYAYTMLLPIVTALGTEGIDERQRSWIRGRLAVMGQKLGLGICDRFARTIPHVIFQTYNPFRAE